MSKKKLLEKKNKRKIHAFVLQMLLLKAENVDTIFSL
jgi:hypothetical protein